MGPKMGLSHSFASHRCGKPSRQGFLEVTSKSACACHWYDRHDALSYLATSLPPKGKHRAIVLHLMQSSISDPSLANKQYKTEEPTLKSAHPAHSLHTRYISTLVIREHGLPRILLRGSPLSYLHLLPSGCWQVPASTLDRWSDLPPSLSTYRS